ncbi:hypothetical protein AAC387_Pa02g4342 [Persea americana]
MDEGASILVGKSRESQTEVERRNGKIQDDASTQCNKVGSECGMDYSSEFITQEIFKSREALIKWARDVGRRNGFVIVIKTSTTGRHDLWLSGLTNLCISELLQQTWLIVHMLN